MSTFTDGEFWPLFTRDLRSARSRVIIQSPFVAGRRIKQQADDIQAITRRGVAFCTFVQAPRNWTTDTNLLDAQAAYNLEEFRLAVATLQSWGIHVNLRNRIHGKLAVIDDRVLWEGRLSHFDTKEHIRRLECRSEIQTIIAKHRLADCGRRPRRDAGSAMIYNPTVVGTSRLNMQKTLRQKPFPELGRPNEMQAAILSVALAVSLATQASRAEQPKPLPAKTPSAAGKPSTALAVVVGTRVALPMPPGFVPAERFTGFQNQNGASIMVSEVPGPYDKVTAGFDAQGLKTRGMTMVSKETTEVGGYPGMIVQVTQDAYGKEWRKWLVVFGDTETVVLTAIWPEDLTSTLQASLKECLLRVKWDRSQQVDPTAGLNYAITPAPPLKLTKRLQNMLLFTPSGELEVKTTGNPLFLVGPSIAELDMGDHATFANKRLKQVTDLKDFDIKSEQKVNIAGMPGWEILASATDTRTQLPRMVYQTILFGNKIYYIMQGMVDWTSSEGYEQTFKETARRFKLK